MPNIRDHTAGTLGSKNRNTAIGKDIAQHDTRAENVINNNFDRREMLESFEEGLTEGMGEITRIIREFTARIALMEYRLTEIEKAGDQRQKLFYGIIVLLVLILLKLFFPQLG